nr:DNA/RNA non-specific endonuclease [Bacteroidales bacterium]
MTQKKKTRVAIVFLAILVGCGLLTYLFSQKGESAGVQPTVSSRSTVEPTPDLLEIPVLKADRPEQIIAHKGYTVSYNSDWCVPNWVAYELTREEVRGTVHRAGHFEPDPDVKGVCPTYRDYSRSSYTRGHMAPAGDMKWDTTAMRESFYLSNVCPQDHNLNDGDWKVLEEQARSWAYKYGSVYIACGPIMSNNPEVIGRNNVAVPDAFYKVLLCKING